MPAHPFILVSYYQISLIFQYCIYDLSRTHDVSIYFELSVLYFFDSNRTFRAKDLSFKVMNMKSFIALTIMSLFASIHGQGQCADILAKTPDCAVSHWDRFSLDERSFIFWCYSQRPCLRDAADSVGCKNGDLACQCDPAKQEAIGSSALGCVLDSCGAEAGLEARAVGEEVCRAQRLRSPCYPRKRQLYVSVVTGGSIRIVSGIRTPESSAAATSLVPTEIIPISVSVSSLLSSNIITETALSSGATEALATVSSVEALKTSESSGTPAKTSNVMTSKASSAITSSSSFINFPNDQTTRLTALTSPSLAATSTPAHTVFNGGAIGGIAAGGAVFLLTVAIIIIAIYYFRQRRKPTRSVPLHPETIYADTVGKELSTQQLTELDSQNPIRSSVQEMPTTTPNRGPWELHDGWQWCLEREECGA